VDLKPVFESLDSWSISYSGWDFIPNPMGRVGLSEGTPAYQSQLLQLADSAAAD